MSIGNAWQCLSVAEFIDQCNWENSSIKVSDDFSKVTLKQSLAAWQCLTTQDFFILNNWSGQVIFSDNLEQADSIKQAVIFDVTSSNDRFWQCFNWTGKFDDVAEIVTDKIIKDTEEIIAAAEEFTLNDLSQLF